MKKVWLLPFLCLIFFCSYASAQEPEETSKLLVRGQIYGPRGAAIQGQIQFRLSGEDGRRPPESFSTDSKGSFILRDMIPGASYTLIVDSDGKNWATTTERFYALGPRPFITIHLRPLESAPLAGGSVSVAELSQKVPQGARQEYAAAVEQLAAGNVERAPQIIRAGHCAVPGLCGGPQRAGCHPHARRATGAGGNAPPAGAGN
ncbi:MAG: carboxypeptidase-like regulatory domain-containing protein [Acidobacteria bacterium]|nr:carboxypeptidase-like regulatory domain-containing protein [Acidobacteriota bacterium]